MATNDIPRTVADFETQLSTSISVGNTTFSISSATDDDGIALPSGKYCFTIDNGAANKEYLMGDLSGTSVTNVVSVSRQGAESSGATEEHRVGASVIVTDFAVIQRIADILRGILALDGASPIEYDSEPILSGREQIATVGYVLDIVNGGTVNFDKQIISGTAGETLASPDLVYFKKADQRWWKVDADDTTTFDQVQLGVAQGSATAGNSVAVLISGIATNFSGLTPGSDYYASNTAGAISTSTGTYSIAVGTAVTASSLFFDGSSKDSPTFYEKQALVGTAGIPGSTNKYVTEENLYDSETDQTQATQDSTTVVGEANATTRRNRIAQSFVAGRDKIRGVVLYKAADTGSFTGTVTVALQADSSGSPSGSNLASTTITNANWLNYATGEVSIPFSAEYDMVVGTTYWIVVSTSTADNSNHPNLGINTAGGYASGILRYNNTTDGWTTLTGNDLYFKTLNGIDGQISQATSSGNYLVGSSPSTFIADIYTTGTTTTTSSAEVTVYSKMLPAGFFRTNSGFRLHVFGQYNDDVGHTTRIKLNGTTVATYSRGDANENTVGLKYRTVVINNNSLSSQIVLQDGQHLSGFSYESSASVSATGGFDNNATTSSVDTSQPVRLTVTFQNGSNGADDTSTFTYAVLEKVYQ